MTKKLMNLVLALVMCLTLCVPAFAVNDEQEKAIPETMPANTIVTYNDNLKAIITHDATLNHPVTASVGSESETVASKDELLAEEAEVAAIKASAKDLPVHNDPVILPAPAAGMTVLYGSNGEISHIYYPVGSQNIYTSNPSYPKVGHTAPVGTYHYGKSINLQTVTITSKGVTGEGTFTVFRAGVGGSGTTGNSGKTLGTGDVATKMEYDNAAHNTAMDARALDTDILKTVYKNDIGTLPYAVLDVYFWGWTQKYFGYKYSDTLSFPGRYHYNF